MNFIIICFAVDIVISRTLYALMDSSFWVDAINLEYLVVIALDET